ncbi:MAG: tail fiber domain-containing protein [bacterium]|nr:tail fiber domain-containing protein [bacterium]
MVDGKVTSTGNNVTGPLTIDEAGFQVVIDDAARLRVLENGRVGINTEEPEAPLEINGAVKLTATTDRQQTLIYHHTTEIGSPVAAYDDGFRIRYDLDFFGNFEDALVIDKTDFNHAAPDGGIVFANTGQSGETHAALTIRGSGYVGIGTTTPRAALDVRGGPIMPAEGNSESAGILFPRDPFGGWGDRAWIRYYSRGGENTTFAIGTSNDYPDHIALLPERGNVGIKRDDPYFTLDVNGVARASYFYGGRHYWWSDERLKTKVERVTGALDKILALRGVRFEWREREKPDTESFVSAGGDKQLGLIGQEVVEVVPEVVATDHEGMKSVEYSQLVAVCLPRMCQAFRKSLDDSTLRKVAFD